MKKTRDEGVTNYAQMGMAALLPGMVHMVEVMQRQIDEFRRELEGLQNGRAPSSKRIKAAKNSWAGMTPEERSAEMRRRMEVSKKKKATHPRDPAHPGHDAWVEKLRKLQQRKWKSMTPAQQKARIAKMAAGKTPSVKLAVAS